MKAATEEKLSHLERRTNNARMIPMRGQLERPLMLNRTSIVLPANNRWNNIKRHNTLALNDIDLGKKSACEILKNLNDPWNGFRSFR